MQSLKKSIKKFNTLSSKKFLNNKDYLIFIVNNKNKFINKFVHKKLNNNFISSFYTSNNRVTYLNVIINLYNYSFIKKKIKNLLILESFSYKLIGVKYGNNFLDIDFFEKHFLLKSYKEIMIKDLFLFVYLKYLRVNILLKKKLFIFINLVFINLNIFKYNAYNTPSSK